MNLVTDGLPAIALGVDPGIKYHASAAKIDEGRNLRPGTPLENSGSRSLTWLFAPSSFSP